MREIKFRGLRTDGKGWVYGQVHTYGDGTFIAQTGLMSNSGEDWRVTAIEVLPESVGQFIGLKDINGTDLYAGDACMDRYGAKSKIVYVDELAAFMDSSSIGIIHPTQHYMTTDQLVIIGNIHENPELL